MIGTVFRSQDVPAQDRFDCWRELVARTRVCEATSAHVADFRAELHRMELGEVTVWKTSIPPSRFLRTPRAATSGSDPELYHVTLMLNGGLAVSHEGGRAVIGPHALTAIDSVRSYDVRAYRAGPQHGFVEGVAVDLPRRMLPLPADRVREVLGRGLPGREGTGALLAGFLLGLEAQAAALTPAEAPRLGTVVLDLVSAWFAQLLDAEDRLPERTRQQALTEQVRAFVQRNLHEPELTPSAIAREHHVSLSHLHRVFTGPDGETVAAWIRAQRLERAHRDLADPALRGTPIQTVAARWGMPRASDFSRMFRAMYGLSPREHRGRSLDGATGDPVPGEGRRNDNNAVSGQGGSRPGRPSR
ncbi:helix-turn-helix domain-containing protein [Streptomyces sp. NPDC000983]|uniref:helix-turn-helix domain-containing protein n=1 Tax=Streptomyces sp. NPDC000983 TaxID=3154373 RepID=UPI003329493C